ncbi:phage tail protein, partial [Ramlibacter sp. AN1015]|uniref:host specificity protein J n=1 Tax=Ramlibacter sp. AN1015 TaxID=3133428 RepID=UPI0030C5DB97
MKDKNKQPAFTGSKGKGGRGSTFREDENTLKTSQTVRSLFALGEGQIGGLAHGAKSIYVDNVALQNADGTYNFGGKVGWDQRVGLPSQQPMEGFPSASAEFAVNVEVTTTTPQTRTTSAGNIDAMRVTIGLPQGLYEQKTNDNSLVGAAVELAIDKKLTSASSWITDRTVKIDGKTTSPYAESHRVERPAGTGTWDVRLRRVTPDNAAATLRNNTFWNNYTEIQDVRLEYEDTAYVGVAINAKDLGGQNIPVVSFDVVGLIVRVPSNYDPVTRQYAGFWDGQFKMAWTDNPAWHLFDIITHPRYGLGSRINDSLVDKYSFYSAAVYNDALVPNGKGGHEPRFTCNVPIQAREEALRVAQNLASVMHAKIVWMGGRIALLQDRPASSVRLITQANVIDGLFNYSGSPLYERITAINVTWNDPADGYLQRVSTIDADSETGIWKSELQTFQSRYGRNVKEIAAFGATSEAQARREGRWYLDSVLRQTEFASFKMSLNGFDLTVGDVVTIYDPSYAGKQQAGRIHAGSTQSIVNLDRAVEITPGSNISIQTVNGIIEGTINQSGGTHTTVQLATTLPEVPAEGADFIITNAVSPRQFRISKITQSEKNIIDVEALLYDGNKYTRVEQGISLPSPVFSDVATNVPAAPTAMTFTESTTNIDGVVRRALNIGWTAPSGIVAGYRVEYRQNSGVWTPTQTDTNALEVRDIEPGTFNCRAYTINHLGILSGPLLGSYVINTNNADGSALNQVVGLGEYSTGTTEFNGNDLNVKWTYPSTNIGKPVVLKDFEVKVFDAASNVMLREEYAPAVQPGEVQTYSYTYSKNSADTNNAPKRSVKIEVRCRDANNKRSLPTSATFTNPAPAIVNNFTATGLINAMHLKYERPSASDYAGVIIWRGTTSNFTLNQASHIFDGDSSLITDNALTGGQTYYYKIAAYDTFGKSYTGAGLNVSGAVSGTPSVMPGTPSGTSLPTSGMKDGDTFYNTTDKGLYLYN